MSKVHEKRHIKFSSIGRKLNEEIAMGFTYKTRRKINSVAIHCSASPQDRGDDARTIDRWHKQRFGSGLGYHYVILEDGTIQKGRWADHQGAGVLGHNYGTLHICFIGGIVYNDLTEKQREALTALCKVLKVTYSFEAKDFKGHNEYSKHSSRGCPMMNMTEFRATL